ncbi:MAG: DJ-1 family glyoxalase III [Rikenellaceae bacterium]
MKTSYIFLSDSFEDIEAIAIIDIMRRAQIPVESVSMNSSLEVTSSHSITVKADRLFDKQSLNSAEYLILPGGSTKLNEYDELKTLLVEHNAANGRIAAICAAPMVLGGIGLLQGKRATCYPGFEKYLTGATFIDAAVVVDGSIVTSNGPASTLKFAYALVKELCGAHQAAIIQQQMMYKES